MFVSDYPKFTIVMDQGEYQEFAKGKFRCKKCRNYVKLSKMICIHSSKCRIFYNFKLKEPMTNKLDGGYFEFENENYEGENNEIEDEIYEEKNSVIDENEFNEEQITNEVNSQINKIFERNKRYMLQKINDLLYNN